MNNQQFPNEDYHDGASLGGCLLAGVICLIMVGAICAIVMFT